jgi:hypothetical protein
MRKFSWQAAARFLNKLGSPEAVTGPCLKRTTSRSWLCWLPWARDARPASPAKLARAGRPGPAERLARAAPPARRRPARVVRPPAAPAEGPAARPQPAAIWAPGAKQPAGALALVARPGRAERSELAGRAVMPGPADTRRREGRPAPEAQVAGEAKPGAVQEDRCPREVRAVTGEPGRPAPEAPLARRRSPRRHPWAGTRGTPSDAVPASP